MIRPADLLAFAAGLVANQTATEVECRMAAARAYYAVFHEVQRRLPAMLGPSHRVHADMRDALMAAYLKSPPPQGSFREMAALGYEHLLRARRIADYNLSSPFPLKKARDAVALAQAIFRAP
jgi:hypothetical protein